MTNKPKFLDIALAASARGFKVTPLKGKAAFLPSWIKNASSDQGQIKSWAEQFPESNCGIVATQDYFIVDVDDMVWFSENMPDHAPETLMVKTGSGKLHIYFKHSAATRTLSLHAVLNPAWDKKKNKEEQPGVSEKLLEYPSQCVAPGSIHPDTGKAYEVGRDLPIAEPSKEWLDWLFSISKAKASSSKLRCNPLRGGLDLEKLLNEAGLKYEKKIKGGKVYFEYHVKMGKCLVAGRLHGQNSSNNDCCAFVWNPKTNEAFHTCFAASCDKTKATERAFSALGIELQDIVRPWWRDAFRSKAELNQDPLSFVVDRLVPEDGATGLGSQSGHGKTWLMLSIAKAIVNAPCKLWGFFEVPKRRPVLYLIPEGSDRMLNHRMEKLGIEESEDFLVRTMSQGKTLALRSPEVLAAAKGRVVFLDTFPRFLNGQDENTAHEIAAGINQDINDLLAAGAVAVVLAQHSSKPQTKKSGESAQYTMTLENMFRGSGDIGANLSAAHGIKLLDEKKRDRTLLHIECVKPRDFDPWEPFQLQGRPFIDEAKDFQLVKKPGEAGFFKEEKKKQSSVPADPRMEKIREGLDAGKVKDEIAKELNISVRTLDRILAKEQERQEAQEEQEEMFSQDEEERV